MEPIDGWGLRGDGFERWPPRQALNSIFERQHCCGEATVVEVTARQHPPCFTATVVEDDARVDLIFLGRNAVPGIAVGSRLRFAGTAGRSGGRLRILNPRYCFVEGR